MGRTHGWTQGRTNGLRHHYILGPPLIWRSYLTMIAGTLEKRELLQNDKSLFKELRDKLTDLEKRLDSRICRGFPWYKVGVTYTRWGRTTCPNNKTELVYSGYVGGSHYTHKGATVDHLCMPKNPDWFQYKDGASGHRGYVYGAEYGITDDNIEIGKTYGDWDVPCAVCRTAGTISILMIPGKTECSESWTEEYSGYLMAGYYGHEAASQYICVDRTPEKTGSSADRNGKLLYPVEVKCGSLPCKHEHYVEGRELTCVVCSK